ncbi:rho GTPase-activating protein 10-like isoform X4 [Homarus americanus]|uniref:rho GTPase-activating protein 10-like isoform X4 n=1 Tax=Homarus americanus TaxID=6706 RepID=UPI001C43F6C2|nr:rho GTPase-activating protein 10-like isoform X4 [Homarus americanus]
MGLMPLEFKDCLTDSPYFREKLHAHEKELDQTNSSIKSLIKEVKDLYQAARNLSRAKRNLSNNLQRFKFECIGNSQTDDEIVIGGSLREFAKIVDMVEDERERMLERSYEQIIQPLESFRKEAIGGAKEGRKKFEKQTQKFCQSQERYLNLSTKKDGQVLQEADASVEMEQRHFVHASLDYVFLLQEVQERKKFEFVETLLSYMYGWLTFYHQGHEVFNDCNPYMRDLQVRVQRTRENFEATRQESVQLKNKMLEVMSMCSILDPTVSTNSCENNTQVSAPCEKSMDPGNMDKMYTRQGYLFLMEKKAFGTTWTKHYCLYQKENRVFTMIPYNQIQHKICKFTSTETIVLRSCVRRMSDSIDKRFCFDLTAQDKPGVQYTLQALSEEDRKHWMDAMDGKEPMYAHPSGAPGSQEETSLDEVGLSFTSRAIAMLESRGLEDQGLYRLVGVSSKVTKLLQLGLDRRKAEKLMLDDSAEWEVKTITSAIKQYFRNLPEPLMTYKLHSAFIAAAKQDQLFRRVNDIHGLVHKLPKTNFIVLKTLIQHLVNVANKSEKNLMTVSNLGVCFGPTLLRPEEETVAAIMDIKFCNIVVEILIEHFEKIFSSQPEPLVDVSRIGDASAAHSRQTPPKSSPPPPSHNHASSASQTTSSHNHTSASSASLSHSKHPPVLQKVVTSFTTSEPQTVHFGAPSSLPSQLQRSDALSNLKAQTTSSGAYSNMPPPPSATHHWNNTSSISSLNSGLNSGLNSHSSLVSLSSTVASSIAMSGAFDSVQSSRPARPPAPTNGQSRAGTALSFVNPLSDRNDGVQSTSSSSESLSSRSSRELTQPPSNSLSSSPQTSKRLPHVVAPPKMGANGPHRDVRLQQTNHYAYNSNARLGTAYPPTYRQHMETLCKRQSLEFLYSSLNSISGSQSTLSLLAPTSSSPPPSSSSTSNGTVNSPPRRVRTLYACVGENESELSFEPNQILSNVRASREPGWLEGTLNGRTGLIPENYVEEIDDKPPPPRLISQRNTDV